MQRKIKLKPPRIQFLFSRFQSPLYLVTFNTYARQRILAVGSIHAAVIAYSSRSGQSGILVRRYVIMPDHVHLFVCFGSHCTTSLSEWVKGLKRHLTSALLTAFGRRERSPDRSSSFWQPGFHDHLLRSNESYANKWDYVRENPVRAGLVKSADAWPYAGEIGIIDRV